MTYKANAVYTCDQCGKEVTQCDDNAGIAGWYHLEQQQLDERDNWYAPGNVGDFCCLTCLVQWALGKIPEVTAESPGVSP